MSDIPSTLGQLPRMPIPRTPENSAEPRPDKPRCSKSGMLISPSIMFLMYKLCRLVALVYIRQPLRHREGAKPKAAL
jgi:hypothetical protein